ncbi:DNA recombination protein RmuC [Sneathiella chinensis]|uniref:DNA recombination protein RmuC homolog n=1 Tax=Sneathiella chinensis TaxID=349750 RepID=A0ABQ5U2E9_9PROT|nr:DNA recombination protein RmuC [Sneathiella chinensis]GLQ05433.1 DNA recombination protein RmuC [Sneathiella chinensis]
MEYLLVAVVVALVAVTIFLLLKVNRSEQLMSSITANSENMTRLTEGLLNQQAQLEGQLKQMSADGAASRSEITKTLADRLDNVTKRLGDSLNQSTEKTGKSLSELQARLAIIDKAQDNLTTLSSQVVGLQDILANKQARGAFGEIQLNDLVKSALPPSSYEFQVTLGNGRRADCLIKLPNPPGSIVVDAKFPLESYHMLRNAETDSEKAAASRAFVTAMTKHIADISQKYIIDGETAESALLFMPSEAVYAELHANFPQVLEKSYQARVWIVSPTTLMATLNTVRAVLKDSQMREQAGVIQKEVGVLIKDVERLDTRVENLSKHFAQASKDIGLIETSSRKITSRAEKIEDLQLGESNTEDLLSRPAELLNQD